jgi:hypothetical protein
MVVRAILQSILLMVLLVTASFAENYRVPNAVMDQVSGVLGVDMIATQRMPQEPSMQVLSQGGVPFVRFTLIDGDIDRWGHWRCAD